MNQNKTIQSKYFNQYLPYFPMVGLVIYLFTFLYAVSGYPGGSYNQPNAIGYSHFHNFLCDAMDLVTKNGMLNTFRGFSITAHIILSLSMIAFFYLLPCVFASENRNTKLIRVFGVSAMTVLIFMYTPYHDLMVSITGVLGSVALIPLFIELHKNKNSGLRQLAYLCFSFSLVVFFSYETKIGFYYLPFIQKITFFLDAIFVFWSCSIIIKKNKKKLQVVYKNIRK